MTNEDMIRALDTGALNKYIYDYLNFAMERAEISEEDQIKILRAMNYAFDSYTAKEIHELMN